MTKKKRNHPDVEEVLSRPWCYYCERDFDDLKILINHQKAKHFKCERCGRRLNTAGGLSVHMSQVHKENLTTVENALPNRAGLEVEIFGMEGIPEDIIQQHNQRVLTNYHQAEAERRAATGNPAPGVQGSSSGSTAKKPKFESPSDLKKRLAEHKAAKLAAEQNGDGSEASTPSAVAEQPAPAPAPVPQAYTGSPTYPQYQQPGYAPPPAAATATPYNQPPVPPQYSPSNYGQPPMPYMQTPTLPQSQPPYGQPPSTYQHPYAQPPQPGYQQPPFPQPSFSPPPFQNQSPYPNQPHMTHGGPSPYVGQQVGVPRPFGAGSPQSPYQAQPHPPPQPQQQSQHNRTHSPAQNGLPQRTASGGLPIASGLPQRPAVGAPPVNALQFQQMHQGQIPASHNHNLAQQPYNQQQNGFAPSQAAAGPPGATQDTPDASSLDDLISSASKQADAHAATTTTSKPATPAADAPLSTSKEDAADDKAGKKDKDKAKPTRLVYSDNEISPEEKMAAMPQYAFTPSQKSIQV